VKLTSELFWEVPWKGPLQLSSTGPVDRSQNTIIVVDHGLGASLNREKTSNYLHKQHSGNDTGPRRAQVNPPQAAPNP